MLDQCTAGAKLSSEKRNTHLRCLKLKLVRQSRLRQCPLWGVRCLSPRQLLADSYLFSKEGMINNVRTREV
jgi:hypothetical protein